MIKDYIPSRKEPRTSYKLLFYTDASGGYAFDCDENGNLLDSVTEQARENYRLCLQKPEKYRYAFNKVEKTVYMDKIEASGICNCGKRISLYNQDLGACECPYCGQWWNLFGQELKPRERWNDFGELDDQD